MIRTTSEFQQAFRDAHRCSTPLFCVRTADPASTISFLTSAMNGRLKDSPVLHWDIMRGVKPLNEPGRLAVGEMYEGDPEMSSVRPAEMLAGLKRLPEAGVFFMANAHRFWFDEGTM